MEDNAPVHTAHVSRDFLKKEGIKKNRLASTISGLEPNRKFPTSILDHLINSMPNRMKAVIEAKGGST
jgi:hypothetical protein